MQSIKSVSKLKQDLILQALASWEKNKGRRSNFLKEMKDSGWSSNIIHCHGSFKECLWKGSIIAKYSRNNSLHTLAEVKREYEQYASVPEKLRKHFPKTYIFINGLLIQDRVLLKCGEHKSKPCNVGSIVNKFKFNSAYTTLYDYAHNHGHSRTGTVKFFDWVYRRVNPWLENHAMPLSEEI